MKFPRLRQPEDPGALATYELAKFLVEGTFRIVGWCMMVSVIQYAASKSDNLVVEAASIAMKVALLIYITGFIVWRVEFDIIPKKRRLTRWHTAIDMAGNVAVSLGLYWLALLVIGQFVSAIATIQA